MLTGFAAAAVPLALAAALVPGVPAGAQATTTPTAAMAWRNRLREIMTSRSISMPPRIRSAPDYSRRLEEHDRDRPRGRRPVHLVPRVQADELRPQPLSFFARRFRYHAGARSWPAFDAHDDRFPLRPPEDRRRTRLARPASDRRDQHDRPPRPPRGERRRDAIPPAVVRGPPPSGRQTADREVEEASERTQTRDAVAGAPSS